MGCPSDPFDPATAFEPHVPPEPQTNVWGRPIKPTPHPHRRYDQVRREKGAARRPTAALEVTSRTPSNAAAKKSGRGWSAERRAKFMATMAARKASIQNKTPRRGTTTAPAGETRHTSLSKRTAGGRGNPSPAGTRARPGREATTERTIEVIAEGLAVCRCCGTVLTGTDGRYQPMPPKSGRALLDALRRYAEGQT